MPSVAVPLITHEPAEQYHAKAGEFLSSHLLANFRKSPLLYYRKRFGFAAEEGKSRPAFVLGRAAHTLILEGLDVFDATYEVGGPINPRTGQPFGSGTKAWTEWAEAHGREVLTVEQFELISRMSQSVNTHPAASPLLADGVAEGVVRAEYCQVPCQIRMDWFESHTGIVDLKTCDDLTWFEADARRYGYAHQLAFYRAVLAQVVGVCMPVHLIAVEKKEPHRCGVWKLEPDSLAIAQQENEGAIERLRQCLAENHWPTGYEDVRSFDYV